jgi:hypothetical protein
VTFNGTTTTNPGVTVNGAFSVATAGPIAGAAAIPGNTGLFTGEVLASGTPVLPTLNVPYTATLLEPRQLAAATGTAASPISIPAAEGGLLYGAVVPVNSYSVKSNNVNYDSNHATLVYVGGANPAGQTVDAFWTGDGTSKVGEVTVTRTMVNGSTPTQTVAVSVGAYALGPFSASASLSVATAEAPSVQDNTIYGPVSMTYSVANVGYAATGGVDPGNPNRQLFGAPLSAPVQAGAKIAPSPGGTSLTSIVASAGTAGSHSTATGLTNTTLSAQAVVDNSNYTGTVGSQCDILDSGVLAASTTVTMSWRNRDNAENGSFIDPSWSTKLPAAVQWLASDVVNIGGVPSGAAFAMQMSYDDRINAFIDGPSHTPSIEGSYLAKFVAGKWENAVFNNTTTGANAQTKVGMSLSDFLIAEYSAGRTLDQLIGSWGVDLTNQQAWAIVNNGGGEYAVVPEPSTAVLLAAGLIGLIAYRRRKLRTGS